LSKCILQYLTNSKRYARFCVWTVTIVFVCGQMGCHNCLCVWTYGLSQLSLCVDRCAVTIVFIFWTDLLLLSLHLIRCAVTIVFVCGQMGCHYCLCVVWTDVLSQLFLCLDRWVSLLSLCVDRWAVTIVFVCAQIGSHYCL